MQKKSLNSLTELSKFASPSSRPHSAGSLLIGARLGSLGGLGRDSYKQTSWREENPVTESDLERLFERFDYPAVYHNTPGNSPAFTLEPPEDDSTPIILFEWDRKLLEKQKNTAKALSDLYNTIINALLKLNAITPPEYGEFAYEDRKIIFRSRSDFEDPIKQAARLGFFEDLTEANIYNYPKVFLKKLYSAQKEKPATASAFSRDKEKSEMVTEISSRSLTFFVRKTKDALKRALGFQGSMRYASALDTAVAWAQKCLKDELDSRNYYSTARTEINKIRKKAAREAFSSGKAAIYEAGLYGINSTPSDLMSSFKKQVSEPLSQADIADLEDEYEDEEDDEHESADERSEDKKSQAFGLDAYLLVARQKMQDYQRDYSQEKTSGEETLERRISENIVKRERLRMEAAAEAVSKDFGAEAASEAKVSLDDYFDKVYPKLLTSRGAKVTDPKKAFKNRIEELVTLNAEAALNPDDMLKKVAFLDAAARFLHDCSIAYVKDEEDQLPKIAATLFAVEEKLSNISDLDVYQRATIKREIADVAKNLRDIMAVTNLYFDDKEVSLPKSPEERLDILKAPEFAKGSFFEGSFFIESRKVGARISEAEEFADIVKRDRREGTYLDDYIEKEALKAALKSTWENLGLAKRAEKLATKLYYLFIRERIATAEEKSKYSVARPEEFLFAPSGMSSQIDADIIAAFVKATGIHPPLEKDSSSIELAEGGANKVKKKRAGAETERDDLLVDEDKDEDEGEDEDDEGSEDKKETKGAQINSAFIVFRGIPPFSVNKKSLLETLEGTCPQIPYPPTINGITPAVPSLLLTYYKLLKARTALICAKFSFVGGNRRISSIVSNTTDYILKILDLNEISIDTQKVSRDISDFAASLSGADGDAVRHRLDDTLLKYAESLSAIRNDAKSFRDSRELVDSVLQLRGVTGTKKPISVRSYVLNPDTIDADVRKIIAAYKKNKIRPLTVGNTIAASLLYTTFAPDVFRMVVKVTKDGEQTQVLLQELYSFAFMGESPGILDYKEKADAGENEAAKYFKYWMARQAQLRRSSLEKESGREIAVTSGDRALVIKRTDSDKFVPLYTREIRKGVGAFSSYSTDSPDSENYEYPQITENLLLYSGAKALRMASGGEYFTPSDILSDLAGIKKQEEKNAFISAGYDSIKDNIFIPLEYDYSGKPAQTYDTEYGDKSAAFIRVPSKYLPAKITGKSGGVISKDISPRDAAGEPMKYNAYISAGPVYTTQSLLNYSAKVQKFLASLEELSEKPVNEHAAFLASLRPRKKEPVTEVEKFLASRTESASAPVAESEKIQQVLGIFLSSVITKKRALESGIIEERKSGDMFVDEEGELSVTPDVASQAALVPEFFDVSGDKVFDKLIELTLFLIETAADFNEIDESMGLAVRLYREKLELQKDKDLVIKLIKERKDGAKGRAIVGPQVISQHINKLANRSDFIVPGTQSLPSEDQISELLTAAEKDLRRVWKSWLDEKYPDNKSFPFYRENVALSRDADAETKTPSAVAVAMFKDHTRYQAYNEQRRHKRKLMYKDFEFPSEKMQKYKPARLPNAVYYLVETPINPDDYASRGAGEAPPSSAATLSIDNMPVELHLVMQVAPPPVTVLHKDLFIKEKTSSGRVAIYPRFCLCLPKGATKQHRPTLYDRSADIFANLAVSPPDDPIQREVAAKKLEQSITLVDFGRIGQRGAASLIDEITAELLYDMDPKDERGTRKRIYAAYLKAVRAEAAAMQPLNEEIAEIERKIAGLGKKILEETKKRGRAPDILRDAFDQSISEKEVEKERLKDRRKELAEKAKNLEYEMGYDY